MTFWILVVVWSVCMWTFYDSSSKLGYRVLIISGLGIFGFGLYVLALIVQSNA